MKKNKDTIIKLVEKYQAKLIKDRQFHVSPFPEEFTKGTLIEFLLGYLLINHLGSSDPKYGNKYKGITKFIGGLEEQQCRNGARRSIGDLFVIARNNYKKDVTLLEVMEAMYTIVNDGLQIATSDGRNKMYIYTCVCTTIHRRVFNGTPSTRSYRFVPGDSEFDRPSTDSHDEFTIVSEDYVTLFEEAAQKRKQAEREAIAARRKQADEERLAKIAAERKAREERRARELAEAEEEARRIAERKSTTLDELVARKLAELQGSSDITRKSLVTKSVVKRRTKVTA